MSKKPPAYDPDDPERESNILTIDGKPIENSTPEQIADELGVSLQEAKKMMGVVDADA